VRTVGLVAALAAAWVVGVGGRAEAGNVTGRVVFRGEIPVLPAIEVAKDHDTCGERVPSEALVVAPASRGVRYAVAFIEGAPPPSAPAEGAEVALENRRCRFVPHVLAMRVGTELAVLNSDPVLHNLRGWLEGHRQLLNVVQPTQGQVSRRPIKRAGVAALSCDTHLHMSGYLLAFEHPYFAVSDAEGAFTLRDVPAGSYTLRIWHEGWTVVRRDPQGRLVYEEPRVLVREVVVPAQGTITVEVDLSATP
jgi:hypothetical protein